MTTIWDRIWPADLQALQNNPKAIPMRSGPYPQICENCGGVGSMMVYVISGGPYVSPPKKPKWLDFEPGEALVTGWYSGEMKESNCPVCQEGKMDAWLERNCGLYESDLYLSLSDLKRLPGKEKAIDTARSLLGLNRTPAGFVIYHGGFGTGKSHLLKGLVNGFRKIGVQAKYSTLSDLLANIRERFGDINGNIAVESVIEQYRKIKVFCIDEVGDPDKVNLTSWTKETVNRLLDTRYNDSKTVLTVMASNINPKFMAPEWGYLASRFDGGLVIEVAGNDMRPYAQHGKPDIPDPVEEDPEPFGDYQEIAEGFKKLGEKMSVKVAA